MDGWIEKEEEEEETIEDGDDGAGEWGEWEAEEEEEEDEVGEGEEEEGEGKGKTGVVGVVGVVGEFEFELFGEFEREIERGSWFSDNVALLGVVGTFDALKLLDKFNGREFLLLVLFVLLLLLLLFLAECGASLGGVTVIGSETEERGEVRLGRDKWGDILGFEKSGEDEERGETGRERLCFLGGVVEGKIEKEKERAGGLAERAGLVDDLIGNLRGGILGFGFVGSFEVFSGSKMEEREETEGGE